MNTNNLKYKFKKHLVTKLGLLLVASILIPSLEAEGYIPQINNTTLTGIVLFTASLGATGFILNLVYGHEYRKTSTKKEN